MDIRNRSGLSSEIQSFVRRGFSPHFGQLKEVFDSNPVWHQFGKIGSKLWLDTGSIEASDALWTREFSALTTNNTLLNREVQSGRYDPLIRQAYEMLLAYRQLGEHERMLEIAFILNARHGLRLVERFDAYVSVEEHTDFAHDVDRAVDCAKRLYAVCPERFIIKIPFTPSGLLATRRLSRDGIPINHTLGFSARQNYIIARIGQPAYLNVFLGRLNSFAADNDLGDGRHVGEKAVLASQAVIKHLRERQLTASQQIGASFRTARQVLDVAGLDVMTIPPEVAEELLSMNLDVKKIADRRCMNYEPVLNTNEDIEAVRLSTLWHVDDEVVACVDALEKENLDVFSPDDLVYFFKEHGCGDVLVPWNRRETTTSAKEGKIPKLIHWQDALGDKSIGLDSLMNLAGLNSFATDQKAMDQRVLNVLGIEKDLIEQSKKQATITTIS